MPHDRTKTLPSTTTTQTPMNRCGALPARRPRILASRIAETTAAGNVRLAGIGRETADGRRQTATECLTRPHHSFLDCESRVPSSRHYRRPRLDPPIGVRL